MNTNKLLHAADCEMKVVCGKQWTELKTTDHDGIRFCGDCKRLVFYTKTAAELKVAAEKQLCVYIVPNSSAERAENFNALAMNFVPTRERIRQIEAKALSRMNRPLMGHAIIRREMDE
jgi:hypothetical protein